MPSPEDFLSFPNDSYPTSYLLSFPPPSPSSPPHSDSSSSEYLFISRQPSTHTRSTSLDTNSEIELHPLDEKNPYSTYWFEKGYRESWERVDVDTTSFRVDVVKKAIPALLYLPSSGSFISRPVPTQPKRFVPAPPPTRPGENPWEFVKGGFSRLKRKRKDREEEDEEVVEFDESGEWRFCRGGYTRLKSVQVEVEVKPQVEVAVQPVKEKETKRQEKTTKKKATEGELYSEGSRRKSSKSERRSSGRYTTRSKRNERDVESEEEEGARKRRKSRRALERKERNRKSWWETKMEREKEDPLAGRWRSGSVDGGVWSNESL